MTLFITILILAGIGLYIWLLQFTAVKFITICVVLFFAVVLLYGLVEKAIWGPCGRPPKEK